MKQHQTSQNRFSPSAQGGSTFTAPVTPSPELNAVTSLAELSDEQLFELYQAGNERAFETIVGRYEPRILGFLYRRLKDPERVKDLAQDTFLRVHRARGRYDCDRKFSTWVYTIANNLLKNEFRNRARRRETAFSDLVDRSEPGSRTPEFEAHVPGPEQITYQGELRDAIEHTIQRLDEHHRTPFVMREVEDLTYDEIAEALGVPVGTIKSRLFRARTAFQNLFPEPAYGTG